VYVYCLLIGLFCCSLLFLWCLWHVVVCLFLFVFVCDTFVSVMKNVTVDFIFTRISCKLCLCELCCLSCSLTKYMKVEMVQLTASNNRSFSVKSRKIQGNFMEIPWFKKQEKSKWLNWESKWPVKSFNVCQKCRNPNIVVFVEYCMLVLVFNQLKSNNYLITQTTNP